MTGALVRHKRMKKRSSYALLPMPWRTRARAAADIANLDKFFMRSPTG